MSWDSLSLTNRYFPDVQTLEYLIQLTYKRIHAVSLIYSLISYRCLLWFFCNVPNQIYLLVYSSSFANWISESWFGYYHMHPTSFTLQCSCGSINLKLARWLSSLPVIADFAFRHSRASVLRPVFIADCSCRTRPEQLHHFSLTEHFLSWLDHYHLCIKCMQSAKPVCSIFGFLATWCGQQ
jgi:hypothetical protein